MRKKVINVFLFVAVLAAAIGMTLYVGQGARGVLLYNFVFLGIMVIVYVAGLFGGMFRMNRITEALDDGAQELKNLLEEPDEFPGFASPL